MIEKWSVNCITRAAGPGRGVAQREFLETARVAAALVRAPFQSHRGPALGQPTPRRRLHRPGKVKPNAWPGILTTCRSALASDPQPSPPMMA